MRRPALTPSLSPAEFAVHYWLKSELAAFCRMQGLATGGAKIAMAGRIRHYLETGKRKAPAARSGRGKTAPMPRELTRDTVIQPGWRCGEAVRSFFERELGARFHFNAAMRDFIHRGAGRRLGDGVAVWEASQRVARGSAPIAPQFEFNRHMRAYFTANPGRNHADAVKAWKEAKARRGTRRRSDA